MARLKQRNDGPIYDLYTSRSTHVFLNSNFVLVCCFSFFFMAWCMWSIWCWFVEELYAAAVLYGNQFKMMGISSCKTAVANTSFLSRCERQKLFYSACGLLFGLLTRHCCVTQRMLGSTTSLYRIFI